ncbi:MAG: hypothetical protein HC936_02770 [Leptolyngbyaceae cyanobacterium SU_3_3]|nr:hypothetical protein [Leptolyngbyaceae cyanobacterium SU_3_3]
MTTNHHSDIRDQVALTNPDQLYQPKDANGQIIDYEQANGRELFNHYRHNMTNYDQVLDKIHADQGHVSAWKQKQAAVGAAEQVLEKYRDEHVKVIKDSQKKGNILKDLMQKAGVGTATALSNVLDSWSNNLKDIAKLENSQRSLQLWNDTYRVQQKLVTKLLVDAGVSQEIVDQVKAIHSTRSVNKAVELGIDLFNLEKSEILKFVKAAVKYGVVA